MLSRSHVRMSLAITIRSAAWSVILAAGTSVGGQESVTTVTPGAVENAASPADVDSAASREGVVPIGRLPAWQQEFQRAMSGATLVGRFSIDGKDDQSANVERYEIRRLEKLEEADYWLFTARIQYGEHDVSVPMPIRVVWADKTPVITVDRLMVPGLGTFDARVLVHGNGYAGTWRHGAVGGQMWGRVERPATVPQAASKSAVE